MDSKNKKPRPRQDRPERKKPLLSPTAGHIVGITGGIATGKTFVLECFRKLGFEAFNADEAVHKLLSKEGKAFAAVSLVCPEAVTAEGIDRKVLGSKVLPNPEKLKLLEGILHPMVREAQVEFMVNTKKTTGKSMVFEVPLLYENKREKYYNFIVVTTAPPGIQKKRAMMRDNMTEEKFNAIIKLQMPDQAKVKKADFVIRTDRMPEDTFKQVKGVVYHAGEKGNSFGHRNDRPNARRRYNKPGKK